MPKYQNQRQNQNGRSNGNNNQNPNNNPSRGNGNGNNGNNNTNNHPAHFPQRRAKRRRTNHGEDNGQGSSNFNRRNQRNSPKFDAKKIAKEINKAGARFAKTYADYWLGNYNDWGLDKVPAIKTFKDQIRQHLPNSSEMFLFCHEDKDALMKAVPVVGDKVPRNLYIRIDEQWLDTVMLQGDADDAEAAKKLTVIEDKLKDGQKDMNTDGYVDKGVMTKVEIIRDYFKDFYLEFDEIMNKVIENFQPKGSVFVVVGIEEGDIGLATWAMANNHGVLRVDRPGVTLLKNMALKSDDGQFLRAKTAGKRISHELKATPNLTAKDDAPEQLSPNKAIDCSNI